MNALDYTFAGVCAVGLGVAVRMIFGRVRPTPAERFVLGACRFSPTRAFRIGDFGGTVGAAELEAFRVCIRRGWIEPVFGVGGTLYKITPEGERAAGF